jgi:predicted nucleotidyltransferase
VEEWERVDYTWTVLVTQDTEIEALLGRLTDEIQQNSNDSLVGLYVYGSLVTGDFDKGRSDIDLLAVVDSDLDGDTFDGLDRMHLRFVEDHPAWGRPYRSGLRACPCALELQDPDRADRGRQPWRTFPP